MNRLYELSKYFKNIWEIMTVNLNSIPNKMRIFHKSLSNLFVLGWSKQGLKLILRYKI